MDIAAERSYNTLVSNSTLFPLLLMSLAYQKNSPDTSSKIWRSYDYIVVGGGTAGSAVAARLSELPCVRVLVLEAGPPPPIINDVLALGRNFWFTDLDWQYKTVPQKHTGNGLKNNQLTWPGGKALGGSSILNAAMFVRGNRKDYDSWEEDGAKGWSFDDVLPYFKKLEDNQDPEYIENGFHGVGGPVTIMKPHYKPRLKDAVFKAAEEMGYRIVDPNTGIQTGFYDVQATLRNNQRCSAAKAYLVPAENRTNLDILANAHVRKTVLCEHLHRINNLQAKFHASSPISSTEIALIVIFKNGRAFGVLFDYDGRTYFVKSTREVILSAGAINTAQVLMLSGIGPKEELEKHGIPVIADLPVGKNLQDHGGTVVNFVLSPDTQEFTEKLSDDENIKRFIETRTGPLASPEGVSNIAFLQDDEIDPAEDAPNYQLYFSEGSTTIPKDQWNLKDEVYRSVYQPYEMQPILICFVSQLHPKSRGSVTLQSADPYDPPLIDPNYLSYPEEVDELVEGMKTCKRVANNRHMRRVVSRQFNTFYPGCEKYAYDDDAYFKCQARTEFLTLSHPAGTAKMGDPEDPTTVVDSKLRVKFVEGLRVVDNSIMPTLIRGNTGVPAMMIGEKAADIIKQDIPCYHQRKFPLDDYF